jgi:hypothetical protein
MSTRERWIVYPLLFLTLGIALRNQFLPTRRFGAVDLRAGEVSAQRIICYDLVVLQKGECDQFQCKQMQFNESLGKHLRVTGLAECMQLKSGREECQAMVVADPEGKPVILAGYDKNARAGVIQTMNTSGVPQVQIRSTDSGGLVTSVGHSGRVLVAMGHEGQNSGVFGQIPQVGPPFLLTPPWRLGIQTTPIKPAPSIAPVTPPQTSTPPSNQPSTPPANQPTTQPKDNKTP